jgi:hypothetical protein
MFPKWRQIADIRKINYSIIIHGLYSSILSVPNRPFQDAKVCGELIVQSALRTTRT